MKIPTSPRVAASLRSAQQFILTDGIRWLPVDPFDIALRHRWRLLRLDDVARQLNAKPSEVINGEDGETWRHNGRYRIVYNDRIRSLHRIRWTIAHEIGHIVLGHLADFDQTMVSRGGLTTPEYGALEREADIFATELLAPMAVLKEVGAREWPDIAEVCLLSRKAAENRQKDLERRASDRLYCEADTALCGQFRRFLTPVTVCCGSSNPPRLSIPWREGMQVGRFNVGAKSVEAGEDGRVTECPVCGNVIFSPHASFCKMCGTPLYNSCREAREAEEGYDDQPCQELNPADARYCEYCGRKTVFARLGILMSWEEVVEKYGDINEGLNMSTFKPPKREEYPDDGVPF